MFHLGRNLELCLVLSSESSSQEQVIETKNKEQF